MIDNVLRSSINMYKSLVNIFTSLINLKQNMKISALCTFLPLVFLVLFSPVSCSDSPSDFIQCLTSFSLNSTSISKLVYTPNNSSYTSVLSFSSNNLRFVTPSTPKPSVIVTPTDESQVQTVILCSRKYGMQIRIRCGGHDYEGLSYVSNVPFVLLDMINLRAIDVDVENATAWVQSGATLGELYYAINNKSKILAFPGGVWPTVGVSGLIGGGGYGILRRKYGLAADNVLDARLVDVNGRILDRKSMGEDLFWAIRGGVASSFGVVISWKLQLVSVPEIVTILQVTRSLEQNATQLVYKWQTVAPKLPKDLEIRIAASKFDPTKPAQVARTVLVQSTVQIRFISLFLGRIDDLLPLLDERFPELGAKKEDCAEMSYIQAALTVSLFSPTDPPEVLLNRTSYKIPFKAKSEYAKQPISIQGLNGIWEMLLKYETGKTNMILTSYGGQMDEIPESSIPFPHRAGTLYKIYMRVQTDGNTAKAMNWIRSLYDYLGPYVYPRTSYVNYNDLDLGSNNPDGPTSYEQASEWGKKYFKNNFDRLIRVKSVVDPTNFFRHEQSIPIIA